MKAQHLFCCLAVVAVLFTACKDKEVITYPATGAYGENILSENVTSVKAKFPASSQNSMKADVPKEMSLKIVLKGGEWAYDPVTARNWRVSEYDSDNLRQEFTITKSGKSSDVDIQISSYAHIMNGEQEWTEIEYITIEYYENGATTPKKTKKLYITGEE